MEEIDEFIEEQADDTVKDASQESTLTEAPATESMRLTMVSHFPKEQFNGLAVLRKWMEKKGFMLESFEYKVVAKKEIKRPINPKNPNGPMEKVVIDEKVNLNIDFKNLRQLIARIGQEPQNVMAVQLERAKGEYFCLNLIFKQIFKAGRPVLVTFLPPLVKSQLLSIPDLNFVSIPKEVEANEELKKQLLDRAGRTRGMQSTMRELAGLPFFPGKILNKISGMSAGQKVELTDAESINLLLLADLHNRYSAMLDTFEADVKTQKVPVPALTYMFNEFMQDVGLPTLLKRFQPYLAEYEGKFKSKGQLFGYLYSILPKLDEKKPIKSEIELSSSDVFRRIRSLFINSRSQYDPTVWQKCTYIDLDNENLAESLARCEPALEELSVHMKKIIEGYLAATSGDLNDLWAVHTCHKRILGREVKLNMDHLDPYEAALIKHAQLHWFGLKLAADDHPQMLDVFQGAEEKASTSLFKSVHLNARAYGVFLAHQMQNAVEAFLAPGLQNLIERYGGNFFDILYESCVKEKGLPISRNQLAKWLQDKRLVGTLKNRGWIASSIESAHDKNINQRILNFTGESALPMVFTQDDFEEKYESSKENLTGMINSLSEKVTTNPLFTHLIEWKEQEIIYPFYKEFSKLVNQSSLYEILNKLIISSSNSLLDQFASNAVRGKLVLKVPLHFEKILLIGHTFDVTYGQSVIKLHLIPVPVESSEKLKGLSKSFSSELEGVFEGGGKTVDQLNEIAEFLLSVKNHEFFSLSRLMFMDRLIAALKKERSRKKFMLPNHIRNFVKDQQKLLIGNTKGSNLGGIFTYETGPKQMKAEDMEAISFGQMVEALESITEVSVRLKQIKEDGLQLLTLLSKFNDKIKASDGWKQIAVLMKNFVLLVSTPVNEFSEQRFAKLQEIAEKLRIKFLKNQDNPGSLPHRLIGVWKKRNPGNPEGFRFYMPFAENQGKQRDDLVSRLHKAKGHMSRIKHVRVLVFFPEGAKKFHINHLLQFSETVKDLPFPMEMFIETSSISREQVEELCRVYHPQQLFRVSRLEPLAPKKE
jgi:hypothetical protein